MDCSPPGSSVHGISQARILEWVVISFLQGIFPIQGLNPRLLHCRWILYLLSHSCSALVSMYIVYTANEDVLPHQKALSRHLTVHQDQIIVNAVVPQHPWGIDWFWDPLAPSCSAVHPPVWMPHRQPVRGWMSPNKAWISMLLKTDLVPGKIGRASCRERV